MNSHSNAIPSSERWAHLDRYERKYARKVMERYDRIMQLKTDICRIANRYQFSVNEVQRAKDYAFGSGVSRYQFYPDEDMAAAWIRMAVGRAMDIDEILLRHEVFESNLVINQGAIVEDAHELAQARYPWSERLKQRRHDE
ncbi:MAG: hypothetical protein D6680_14130 [Cyanobacteria bacterium J007]|jgi:hypothetical protein|nr:MAG: hypothetical protein D6680_14130 [Cyanobacteria bacterium J007]